MGSERKKKKKAAGKKLTAAVPSSFKHVLPAEQVNVERSQYNPVSSEHAFPESEVPQMHVPVFAAEPSMFVHNGPAKQTQNSVYESAQSLPDELLVLNFKVPSEYTEHPSAT